LEHSFAICASFSAFIAVDSIFWVEVKKDNIVTCGLIDQPTSVFVHLPRNDFRPLGSEPAVALIHKKEPLSRGKMIAT